MNTASKTDVRYFSASLSAATVSQYDKMERLASRLNPDSGVESWVYYADGTLQSETNSLKHTTHYKYDAHGNLTEQWSPASTTSLYSLTKWTYNLRGNVKSESRCLTEQALFNNTGATFVTTSYSYDGLGRLIVKTDNAGRRSEYAYTLTGQRKQEKEKVDAVRWNTIGYQYNDMGLLSQKTTYAEKRDIDGQSNTSDLLPLNTSYAYDIGGNLASIADPDNVTTNYTYDALGRELSKSRPGRNENGQTVTITTSQTYNNLGKIDKETDARGKVTQYGYSAQGFLTQKTAADSGVTAMEYDWAGRLTKLVSPQNQLSGGTSYTAYVYDGMDRKTTVMEYVNGTLYSTQTTAYDKAGHVLSTTDAMNNTTSYTYDAAGRLTKTTDPLKFLTSATYDALNRKSTETDADGYKTNYTYDDMGNLLSVESVGVGIMSQNSYDLLGRLLTKTDAMGNTTIYTYNAFNQVYTVILPGDGNIPAMTTANRYDKLGRLIRSTDSTGRETVFAYDPQGRVLSKTEQKTGGTEKITVQYAYDVAGNVVKETDGNGKVMEHTYDNMGRRLTSKDPLGHVTTIAYDKNGNKTTVTDWRGNVNRLVYDPLNRITQKVDPYGKTLETLAYNANGSQVSSKDANGKETTFAYDKKNRLISTTTPYDGATKHTETKTYDKMGRVSVVTDKNGKRTTTVYDRFSRMTAIKGHSGETLSSYEYDRNGNLLKQLDGGNKAVHYTYNARNLPVTRSDNGGGVPSKTESYTYNADGTLAQKTDRNGIVTVYVYDIHGRLLSQTAGGNVISHTYDNNGNQLTMTDSTGTTTRTYDALNRVLTKEAPNTGKMTFTYDVTTGMASGHKAETSTDSKGNMTTKIYDKAGRLYQAKNGNTVSATYEYNDNGSLKKLTYSGGATEEYTYYDNNKLKTLANKHANGQFIDTYKYWYDGNGNMAEKLDGSGTTLYVHDILNRLTKVTESDGTVTDYAYDGSSNRKTETVTKDGQTATTDYIYDQLNQLTQTVQIQPNGVEKTVTFAYDNNGNLRSRMTETLSPKGVQTPTVSLGFSGESAVYEYDVWNNMSKAVVTGGPQTIVTTNTYNGDGLRVSKTVDSLTTYYAYEYNEIVLELDGNKNQTAFNLRGLKLVSRTSTQGTTYFMYNGQGDVTALTDGGNALKASYYYDAFGNHKSQTGSVSNPYRYRGYQFDEETGLYYLKARFYDPLTSRMLQEDSYRGNVRDPLSLNLYTYCENNPLIYWDPTGHYLSPTDKANLSDDDQKKIEAATDRYNSAPAGPAGDEQRRQANIDANDIRAKAGYSGGTNGGTITVNAGKTVTVIVEKDRTVTNYGNIPTLTVRTGVTSTINNYGMITNIINYGTVEKIYNSSNGYIGTINNKYSNGISTISNHGTVEYILNNSKSSIDTINNYGAVTHIENYGTVGTIKNYNYGAVTKIENYSTVGAIKNYGTVERIYNGYHGSIGKIYNYEEVTTIDNYDTVGTISNSGAIGSLNMKKGISAITNTGAISSLEIGADSTVNVTNTGAITSVYIGSNGIWYFNKEKNAIEDFQKIYTNGSYAAYEYATFTFASNLFGDGNLYYGYDTPITIKQDNVVIPPVWNNSIVISYLHTHPNGNINHSGMDKIVAEVAERPFYVVTSDDYRPYVPQYGGNVEKILKNIGPEVGENALGWIKHYWDAIWK